MGSPLWANKLVTEREKPLANKVYLRFLDSDPKCIDHLRAKLGPDVNTLKLSRTTTIGDFRNLVLKQLQEIDDEAGKTIPVLAFIAPWGIKVPYSIIKQILQRKSAEVFLYFNLPGVVRNLDNDDGLPDVISLYGTPEVSGVSREPREKWNQLLQLYLRQLRAAAQSNYITHFAMKNEQNRIIYYLIFVTKAKQGFYKMKEAMWKLDKTGAFSFSDAQGDQLPLFQAPELHDLKVDLLDALRSPMSGTDVEDYVKYRTQFLTRHKTEALFQLESEGLIVVEGPADKMAKRQKRHFPPWCTIRLKAKQ